MADRLNPVLRCKEALDLLGDALLYAHKADLEAIECRLMWALKHGDLGKAMPTAKKAQRVKALVNQWEECERKQQIQRLREESRNK